MPIAALGDGHDRVSPVHAPLHKGGEDRLCHLGRAESRPESGEPSRRRADVGRQTPPRTLL
ncbi:hypothetical protein C3488_31445 [Streptomyces sp. Ru72]|nr:hypothetical protein C3488_31445 [Streptomyces sp. Ru72]